MSNFSFSIEDFLSGNIEDAVDREMHKDLKDPTKPLRTTSAALGGAEGRFGTLSIGEILMGTKNFNSSKDIYEVHESAYGHMLSGFLISETDGEFGPVEGLKTSGANYDILVPADIRASAKKYRDQYGGGGQRGSPREADQGDDTTAPPSGGALPPVDAPWKEIDEYLKSKGVRIGAPTSGGTTGGKHASGSLHYQGRARDYGDAANDCWGVYNALLPLANSGNWILEELFWDPANRGWKRGTNIGPIGGHSDHVHAGIGEGKHMPGYGS